MTTEAQAHQLNELKKHGTLYVGYQARDIMRIFDTLVEKGFATVSEQKPGYGKQYKPVNE